MSLDREEGDGRLIGDKEGRGHSSIRPRPIIRRVSGQRPRLEDLSY